MKTLNLSVDSFDQENTFQVDIGARHPVKASLRQDYNTKGDGIYWALLKSACLKDVYTDADRAETARLDAEGPLKNGEVVLINGEEYKVRVKGRYSDCAMFDKV